MRPPKIKITVTNKRNFKSRIGSAQNRLSDRTPVHRSLYNEWFNYRWILNFKESGRLYTRWEPLAEWTQEDRRKKGYGADRPKLEREGWLFSDFTEQISDNATVTAEMTNWDFVNNPPHYALSHHVGFENPIPTASPVPARILWDINREDQREVKDRFLKYIINVLSKY